MPITIGEGLSFCGRRVRPEELELIRQITRDFRQLPLTELAHTVCELLEWRRPNGGLKSRECYLFLQALHERGWLPWLPAPRPSAHGPRGTRLRAESEPQPPCTGALEDWRPLAWQLIEQTADRQLFRQYIERYHYLGYRIPYGAQLRYFVRGGGAAGPVLACLLFSSAAWRMAPRDRYIGWSDAVRAGGLARLVSNSRFLILPWVRIANLASHVLSQAAERVRRDWSVRYGVEPVLVETLVDRSRYAGTCYRAANWTSVGLTQGRGRMDRSGTARAERKEIFVFPCSGIGADCCADRLPRPAARSGDEGRPEAQLTAGFRAVTRAVAGHIHAATHLRARAPAAVRPADEFTAPPDLARHLRYWPAVPRLDGRLPRVFAKSVGSAPLV